MMNFAKEEKNYYRNHSFQRCFCRSIDRLTHFVYFKDFLVKVVSGKEEKKS